MCKFEEIHKGKTVYQVGICQLMGFIDSGMSNYCVSATSIGDYVIVESVAGIVSEYAWDVNCLDSYKDVTEAFEDIDKYYAPEIGLPELTHEYEVWHVMDDAELWQVWEHDSAIACRESGQGTHYHVYEGPKCVLDFVREVPRVIYCMRAVDSSYEPICSSYYADPITWAAMVDFHMQFHGWTVACFETNAANLQGLCVVDDWQRDEGLSDKITVLNVYLRA